MVFWGIVHIPISANLIFAGMVTVRGYELSGETVRGSQSDRKLRESEAGLHEIEERMRLAVEAVDFGIWIRDLAGSEIWATDECRALLALAETERLELDRILKRIHLDDREAVRLVPERATERDGSYETEY